MTALTKIRLVMAIIGTLLWEGALVVLWRWGLPELGIELSVAVLIVAMVVLAVYSVVAFWVVTPALSQKPMVGLPGMIGSEGKVVRRLAPDGQVKIKSEIWEARSVDGYLDKGERVSVVGQESMKLFVRKGKSRY